MSHLQKAFIAKNKGKMNRPARGLSRALREREASHVIEKRSLGGLNFPTLSNIIYPPHYLAVSLKK